MFARADLELATLADLAGRRVAVGVEGSGTRSLATQLLAESGAIAPATALVAAGGEDTARALATGEDDAAFVVGRTGSPRVGELAGTPGLRALRFVHQQACEPRSAPTCSSAATCSRRRCFRCSTPRTRSTGSIRVSPALRVLPALYAWRIQSRMARWYGRVSQVEHTVDGAPSPDEVSALLAELDAIEAEANAAGLPSWYAGDVYRLRAAIDLVRERLGRPGEKTLPTLREAPAAAPG